MEQPDVEAARQTPPRKSPSGGQRVLPVVYVTETSATWDRARFRRTIDAPSRNPAIARIARRREELAGLGEQKLHGSYNPDTTKDMGGIVSPRMISIPPRYGTAIYMLATEMKARRILEAGAGFGISSMYLAAAARNAGGSLTAFEIAPYATQAQASVAEVCDRSQVIRADFDTFATHLPGRDGIDFAFIDARHDADSILRSYKAVLGWLRPRAMIVIDDMWYSASSRLAWQEIVRRNDFGFAAIVNRRLAVLAT